ncbi:MAG: hypothetical protein AAB647_02375, partial [Patescibacteria group bacterium]
MLGLALVILLGSAPIAPVQAANSQSLEAQPRAGLLATPGAIQQVVHPGERLTGTLQFTNPVPEAETITVRSSDLAVNNDGMLIVLPDNTGPFRLGESVTLPETAFPLVLQSNEQRAIDYQIELPALTEPGDYFGVLLFRIASANLAPHEFGLPIMVRLTNDLTITTLDKTFNPDAPLVLPAGLTVEKNSIPNYEIVELATPWLSLNGVQAVARLKNHRPTAQIAHLKAKFLGGNDTSLAESTVETYLESGAEHDAVTIRAPHLVRTTRIGRLPYLGFLSIRVSTPGQTGATAITTFVLPWWIALLLLLATIGLVSRTLSLIPHLEHRPLRWQGRVSLTMVFALLGLGAAPSLNVSADGEFTIRVQGSVAAYAGYTITIKGDEMVIQQQTNYLLQVNTPDQIYLLRP